MPALPNADKVIRVSLRGLFGEDTNVVNRFFLQYSATAPTVGELNTFAAATLTELATHWLAQIGAGYTTISSTCEDLTSPTSAVGFATGTHSGTDTGVTENAAFSFIIQQKIARRYRGGHPRLYFCAVSNAHLTDDQKWDGTFGANTVAAWGNYIAALGGDVWSGGGGLSPVNVSYYEGFHNFTYPSGRTRPIPTLRGTPVIDPILTYDYNHRPGSQRRRNLQGQ